MNILASDNYVMQGHGFASDVFFIVALIFFALAILLCLTEKWGKYMSPFGYAGLAFMALGWLVL